MKLYYRLLLIFMMLFTSCYNVDKPDKPRDLLSQDEMVAVLVDMAIMSSAKGINKKKIENSGIVPDEYIFKKHNIDSIRFNSSNNYYAYNVDDYGVIYKQVKDSLTILRDYYKVIETKEKKEKAKLDSIRKIQKKDSISKVNDKSKRALLKRTRKERQLIRKQTKE